MNKFVFILILGFAGKGFASYERVVSLTNAFGVHDGETVSKALQHPAYVKNLVIQAHGDAAASTIEVMVNGETKGTIYAPGQDPSYVVTVEAQTHSIEFRHRSGGTMRVLQVLATLSTRTAPSEEFPPHHYTDTQRRIDVLAKKVIQIVGDLQPYSDLQNESQYLIPLKKAAAMVRVMNSAHGSLGKDTRKALLELEAQIAFSESYIQKLLEQHAMFDAAVELMTIQETISELLD